MGDISKISLDELNNFDNKSELISNMDIEYFDCKWCTIDNLEKNLKYISLTNPYIVNTGLSTGQGIHWVVVIKNNNNIGLIDPLGHENNRDNNNILNNLIDKYNLNLKIATFQIQKDTSVLCGYFAIYICHIIKNNNFNSIDEIFYHIKNIFGSYPDIVDVYKIYKWFKFYLNKEGKLNGGLSVINKIKNFLKRGYRDNFPPQSYNLLKTIGQMELHNVRIGRKPVNNIINKLVNLTKQKNNTVQYNNFFHLYLIFQVGSRKSFIIEKNENINIEPYKPDNKEAIVNINKKNNITLNKLINLTLNRVGKDRFFKYRATTNNCQTFVYDLIYTYLKSNIPHNIIKFIKQDTKDLLPRYINSTANIATDTKSLLNIILGKGII